MSKTQITRAEYLQLLGLKMMGNQHLAKLDDLIETAKEIVGEEDQWAHVGDMMFTESQTVDETLRKLTITVLPEPPRPSIMEGWEVEPHVIDGEQAYSLVHATKGRILIPNESADLIEALLKLAAPAVPQENQVAN
jgi:hypothetical protein